MYIRDVPAPSLLAPSFASGFVSLVLSTSVVGVILSPFLYRGSYLEQYGEVLRRYPGGWGETYAQIVSQLNSSEVVANISIFCVWAVAGFGLYYLALSLLSLLIDMERFKNILGHKNTDKQNYITFLLERLLIRVAGLVGLVGFMVFVFHLFVPILLTLIAAAFSSPLALGIFYILCSVIFLAVVVHLTVVLLRIVFLRARLISWR